MTSSLRKKIAVLDRRRNVPTRFVCRGKSTRKEMGQAISVAKKRPVATAATALALYGTYVYRKEIADAIWGREAQATAGGAGSDGRHGDGAGGGDAAYSLSLPGALFDKGTRHRRRTSATPRAGVEGDGAGLQRPRPREGCATAAVTFVVVENRRRTAAAAVHLLRYGTFDSCPVRRLAARRGQRAPALVPHSRRHIEELSSCSSACSTTRTTPQHS